MLVATEVRIMITAKDRTLLKDFYVNTLGFKVKTEFSSGTMIDLGSAVLELFYPKEGRSYPDKINLSIMVENVDDLWTNLQSHMQIVSELHHNSWGDTSFAILDPQSNELVFFSLDKK